MIPKAKGWNETTYQDELPAGSSVRVNRKTIGPRLRNCRYLLRRGGGIFHEPGGKVFAAQGLPLIEEMIADGRLRDDGMVDDPPDARIFTYTARED